MISLPNDSRTYFLVGNLSPDHTPTFRVVCGKILEIASALELELSQEQYSGHSREKQVSVYTPEFMTWQKEANRPCNSEAGSLPFPAVSPAVKVSGFLPVELAFHSAAVLRGTEPLKPVIDELRVLLVKVLMGHHVRSACIDLVTTHLPQAKTGSRQHSVLTACHYYQQ